MDDEQILLSMRSARGSDTNSIKKHLPAWLDEPAFAAFHVPGYPRLDPAKTVPRGFNHPVTGALLCPADLDYNMFVVYLS